MHGVHNVTCPVRSLRTWVDRLKRVPIEHVDELHPYEDFLRACDCAGEGYKALQASLARSHNVTCALQPLRTWIRDELRNHGEAHPRAPTTGRLLPTTLEELDGYGELTLQYAMALWRTPHRNCWWHVQTQCVNAAGRDESAC